MAHQSELPPFSLWIDISLLILLLTRDTALIFLLAHLAVMGTFSADCVPILHWVNLGTEIALVVSRPLEYPFTDILFGVRNTS